jgi:class 3 adenylate cyclase/tetratricopeptide (TPR) repeat protein
MRCPSCSVENPPSARFCMACGAPLETAEPSAREERKVVTVLFADLVGFTARAERLDPEDVRAVLAPYHAHLRSELERFGGTVEKFIGDAVMALFGAPVAHEDDPERAVRAALDIRDWVREQEDLQLRIAINTGEALVALGARAAEGEGMAAGDVVNTAARLQSAAPVNGVLVGETTYRATRHAIEYREAEPVEAKGKSEPIRVWEALEARSRLGVDLGEAKAPLVGRERELDRLRDALDVARRQRQLQLVTLVGVPGIGKSRLVQELFKVVEAEPDFTTWRQGRSLPYGEGVSFWALAEIVKAQAGILESDSEEEAGAKLRAAVEEVAADPGEVDWLASRMRSLVGLQTEQASQSESFSAWRSFLEALADERPLVLVFEDLHWADDGLLDFVDQLVEWARSAPILVLCTARPELLERRPGWGGGKANAATISLPPLEDEETARLLASLLESPVLAAETQSELLARAAGNPLYAEQFAHMLAERGTAEALPETVQGIIAARLDHLSETEKALLQDAAVVGKVFWLGSVCGDGDRAAAEEALLRLERRELVQRARRSSVEGEGEYAFRHLLVREVAYGQIPRVGRAGKHLAVAKWVEALGRPEDHAELLASHYSRALEYARAAGADDVELVERARSALRNAGARAAALDSWGTAARFYEEALELWPEDDLDLPDVQFQGAVARFFHDGTGLDLVGAGANALAETADAEAAADAAVTAARIHWIVGDTDAADRFRKLALRLVGDRPDSPARVSALTGQLGRLGFDGHYEAVIEEASRVLPDAERLGLARPRVRILNLRGDARVALGDEGGFDDFDSAIALGSELRLHDVLQSSLNNKLSRQIDFGRVDEVEGTIVELRRNAERLGANHELRWVGEVEAEVAYTRGRWHEAVPLLDAFIAESEVAPHYLDPVALNNRALIRRAKGDLEGAASDSERSLEVARKADEAQILGLALVGRAAALLDTGRRADALALAREVIALDNLVLNDFSVVEAAWVMLDLGLAYEYGAWVRRRPGPAWPRAAELICSGDLAGAADLLERIRYRPGEAQARLRLARELVEQGRRAEADVELQRALAFWREVGATRYVREGEALLAASA